MLANTGSMITDHSQQGILGTILVSQIITCETLMRRSRSRLVLVGVAVRFQPTLSSTVKSVRTTPYNQSLLILNSVEKSDLAQSHSIRAWKQAHKPGAALACPIRTAAHFFLSGTR